MHEFRTLLAAILQQNLWTQQHVAGRLNTDQATVSRWLSGRVPMSMQHIGRLISIIPEEQKGPLLKAFLQDQIPSGCGHLIAVQTTGAIAPELTGNPVPEFPKDLTPDMKRNLVFISELAVRSPNVRKIADLIYRIGNNVKS